MDDKTKPLLAGASLSSHHGRSKWIKWFYSILAIGILDLVLVLTSTLASYSTDFWKVGSYTFRTSLLDVASLCIIRAALCCISAFPSSNKINRASKLAILALLWDLITLLFMIIKASLFHWGKEDIHAVSSWSSQAILAIVFVAGVVELPLLYWYLKALKTFDSLRYAKLENESWIDVENGKDGQKKEEEGTPKLTTRQFLKILKPYFWPSTKTPNWQLNRIRCISTWIFVAGSKVSSVYSPLFLAFATSALSQSQPDYHKAAIYIGIYCSLVFGSRFLKEAQSLVYLGVKQVAYAEICQSTFEHLLGLSLQWHLKKKIGQVIRAMDRGTDAADTIVVYLFLYLLPAVGECIAVCVIFLVHFDQWDISVLLFSSLSLYGFVTIKMTLWRRKFREASNQKDNEIHERATDSLVNFETVKAYTNEDYEKDRFGEAVRAYQKFSITTQASLSLLNIIQQFIIQACSVGCLIIAAHRVYTGSMDLGDFVAVNVYTLNAFQPLNFLGSVYTAVIKALVDMQNLNHLLLESPDVTDVPGAKVLPAPSRTEKGLALKFDNVCFHYPEQPALMGLKNVSFEVAPGTTTALVGHTGSGKTTISRLLFRYYDVTEGAVVINGHDVRDVKQTSLRALIGIVPQDTCLFNDTLLHNIRYGRLDATMEEVEAAAEAAQLKPFINSLPLKYETVVGERGLKLSGGEKQRVAIARCLLKDPPMVLLDEATSALDTKTEKGIQDALARLRKDRTSLIIAHRLSTIKHADQIIVLDQGRIVERGTHDDLLKAEGEYSHMWHLQLKGNRGEGFDLTAAAGGGGEGDKAAVAGSSEETKEGNGHK